MSADEVWRACKTSPRKASPRVFPAEVEEGNIEYKLKLVNPTPQRLEHLISQMKWRLEEGHGEATYFIGLEDDGTPCGLKSKDMKASIKTLTMMARSLDATIVSKDFINGTRNGGKILRACLRRSTTLVPDEVRGIVLGSTRNGKSTLVAAIVSGEVDDGEGLARMNVLRHKHELDNGQTSCVTTHTLGYDEQGIALIRDEDEMRTEVFFEGESENMMENCNTVLCLVDVPGHPRFVKSSLRGLMSYHPNFAILTVSSLDVMELYAMKQRGAAMNEDIAIMNEGANLVANGDASTLQISIGHARLARLIGLHVVVVVTKSDLIRSMKEHRGEILRQGVHFFLELAGIFNNGDAKSIDFAPNAFTSDHLSGKSIPVFLTSCVKEQQGVGNLRSFLVHYSKLNGRQGKPESGDQDLYPRVRVRQAYLDVADVDVVVCGIVENGEIAVGDIVSVGPHSDSSFIQVKVSSIRGLQGHRMTRAYPGHTICLAFEESPSKRTNPNLEPIIAASSKESSTSSTWSSTESMGDDDEVSLFGSLQDFWEGNRDILEQKHNHHGPMWNLRSWIQRGSVILRNDPNPMVVREFKAELVEMLESAVFVNEEQIYDYSWPGLFSSPLSPSPNKIINCQGQTKKRSVLESIQKNWHFVVFFRCIRQTAFVTDVESPVPTERSNRNTVLSLRFMKRSEHLCVGDRILLRNGRAVGVAVVCEVTRFTP